MRSYEVKRRSHFRHSRRRLIESPSRDSRESTTLSSINPQNGHFMTILRTTCCEQVRFVHLQLHVRRLPRTTFCASARNSHHRAESKRVRTALPVDRKSTRLNSSH